MIRDEAWGYIVPPENPGLLAKGIRKLRQQADLSTEMGGNGRSQLDTRFARAYWINMYEHMLLSTLQEDRKQQEEGFLIQEHDHPRL